MGILTPRIHRAALLAGLLLGPAALSGCYNLFKPETPQPPTGAVANVKIDYSSPDTTLGTMALAVANKNSGNGADAWIGAFANGTTDNASVEFDFDPGVLLKEGVEDPEWNLAKELTFYQNMSEQWAGGLFLVWTKWEPGGNDQRDDAAGTAYLPRSYRLYTLDANNITSGTLAFGVAMLSFKKTGTSRWVITKWIDRVHPDADPNDIEQVCFSQRRLSWQSSQ